MKKFSEFTMSLNVLEPDHLDVPESEYCSIAVLPSTQFNRICKELYIISDTLNITTNKDALKFKVKGTYIRGTIVMEVNESSNVQERVELEVSEPVNLSFALRHLNMFIKATPLCDQVSLSLSSKHALMVQYLLPEGLGFIRFYLASRIIEDN